MPDNQTHPLERLGGSVDRVAFHSEESGFCVLRVKVRGLRDLSTVIGSAASVTPGEYVECLGNWINDRAHGLQFKASQLKVVQPSTLEGIEKYLGSGMVKGIGPHFAKKLVKAFGVNVFDIIEQTPQRLTELEGIGPKRRALVTSAWAEQKAIREIMVFLQSNGVGTSRAVRIYQDLWRRGRRQGGGKPLPAGLGHPRHRLQDGGCPGATARDTRRLAVPGAGRPPPHLATKVGTGPLRGLSRQVDGHGGATAGNL